jgi:hypothetical protein
MQKTTDLILRNIINPASGCGVTRNMTISRYAGDKSLLGIKLSAVTFAAGPTFLDQGLLDIETT